MTDVDEQRLNQIRAKLGRICGNKELSQKQWQSMKALWQEYESLDGDSPVDDIFK